MSNTKNNIPFLLMMGLLFMGLTSMAQTKEEVQKIIANYDLAFLNQLANESEEKAQADRENAILYAQQRNLPITEITEDGNLISLQKVLPDGTLLYYTTFNKDAARSTRTDHVNPGGSTGYDLEGENMKAYVWDGGHPRVSHQEYQDANGESRVTLGDGPLELEPHAGHVIGTVAATGVNPQAKGMASKALVKAYQWDFDVAEATAAAQEGMLLSNHSYGYFFLYLPDWMFGAYIDDSHDWDQLMYNAPHYLMVVAAGNDGSYTWWNGDPLASGYDILSGHATAKNNLVVANANDANVDNDGTFISTTLDATSSPGPTDDLRIKPDITGNGVGVFSPVTANDTAYQTMSGTSMASPNVMGSLLLLQEHYKNIYGEFMLAATLKGLALHTADDAGPEGPDAKWGWGVMNTKRAAETISENGISSLVQQFVLNQGETITLEIDSDGINPLQASLSWTDLPGLAVNGVANSPDAVLVNDLDIRITQDTDTYYPWRLTSASTNSNDGDNSKDPYERIDIENASGTYTITITHKGTLETGSQAFSLIVTGITEMDCEATVPENVTVTETSDTSALVTWTSIPGATYDLQYRKTTTTDWTSVNNIPNPSYHLTDLESNSTYEIQVRSRCSENEVSDYSTVVIFSIGCSFDIVVEVEPITRVIFSEIDNVSSPTSTEALEDFTSLTANLALEGNTPIALEGNTNGAYENFFTVWIDWNQNGDWNDEGEMFEIGSINNSTGTDGQQATGAITVPTDALLGTTKMRVIKNRGSSPTDPCGLYDYGQAEDYTVIITEMIGIENQSTVDFTYYPNPVDGILQITSALDIENITVYNLLGQKVLTEVNPDNKQVNLSALSKGTYLVKAVFEGGQTETFKIIKN